jgi:hypothetical protein
MQASSPPPPSNTHTLLYKSVRLRMGSGGASGTPDGNMKLMPRAAPRFDPQLGGRHSAAAADAAAVPLARSRASMCVARATWGKLPTCMWVARRADRPHLHPCRLHAQVAIPLLPLLRWGATFFGKPPPPPSSCMGDVQGADVCAAAVPGCRSVPCSPLSLSRPPHRARIAHRWAW